MGFRDLKEEFRDLELEVVALAGLLRDVALAPGGMASVGVIRDGDEAGKEGKTRLCQEVLPGMNVILVNVICLVVVQ